MSDKPTCQAVTTRKFVCNQPAANDVETVPLCGRHRELLGRRGGITIRRTASRPDECIVEVHGTFRIYDAAMGGRSA